MDKPIAENINCHLTSEVDVPADRFFVRDQNGNYIQVRLEPDGMVYFSYTKGNRHIIVWRELRWSAFAEAFQRFVDSIEK